MANYINLEVGATGFDDLSCTDAQILSPKTEENQTLSPSNIVALSTPPSPPWELIALGARVFPLRKGGTKEGKKPVRDFPWTQEASADPHKIEEWARCWHGCNWGVACGPLAPSSGNPAQLLVVDCDSMPSYEWVISRYPELAETASVETGRDGGGVHAYTWAPPECAITIGAKLELPPDAPPGLKIDVRGRGGYVVAPGSIHETKRVYHWREGSLDGEGRLRIMPAPAEWFDGRDAKHLLTGAKAKAPAPALALAAAPAPAPALALAPAATPAPMPAPAPAQAQATWPAVVRDRKEEELHKRWIRYYESAIEGIQKEVATCDHGDGHKPIWDAACRLHELTQPWQPDEVEALLTEAVERWTYEPGYSRDKAEVLKDVRRTCADARKKVTIVDPLEELGKKYPDFVAWYRQPPAEQWAPPPEALRAPAPAPAAVEPGAAAAVVTANDKNKEGAAPRVKWRKLKSGEEVCEKTLSNLTAILADDARLGVLAYDLATDRGVWREAPSGHEDWQGGALRDCDVVVLCTMIEEFYGVTWSFEVVHRVLESTAQARAYNSFLSEVQATPWDGVDRLSHGAARYFGTDDGEYHNEVLRRWLIGLMARQFATAQKPVKMDYVLLLQGPQGCGKTSGLEALAGARHFATCPLEPSNKDCKMILHSASVVVYDELGGRQRRDIEAVKNLITTTTDKYRRPYASVVEEQPRLCAMAATTNDDTPLYDTTGNRRWWLLACQRVDVSAIERDRAQILAQALAEYHAWKRGDEGARPWWFRVGVDDALIDAATTIQNEATFCDDIAPTVIEYVSTAIVRLGELTMLDVVGGVFRPETDREAHELVLKYRRTIAPILKLRCGLVPRHTKKGNVWVRPNTPLALINSQPQTPDSPLQTPDF